MRWLSAGAVVLGCREPRPRRRAAEGTPDATLRSTPETVVWGYFAADIPPALRIKSGQTVRIDTVSHSGVNTADDPVTYFGRAGIPADQVLKGRQGHLQDGASHQGHERACADRADLCRGGRARRHARSAHARARAPRALWGEQFGPDQRRAAGAPLRAGAEGHQVRPARNVALFSAEIEVPLSPFLGIMAVAPPRDFWLVSSRPPGRWGGNMDFNKLTAGATLYLPVFHNGAQFFTGDSHAVQGDGEVDGTAIEASLTGTLQFIVHKGAGKAMLLAARRGCRALLRDGNGPRSQRRHAEATQGDGRLLRETRGLSAADAYSLASIAVDFRVAEAVDAVQMVYGAIPKKIFKQNPEYWNAEYPGPRANDSDFAGLIHRLRVWMKSPAGAGLT